MTNFSQRLYMLEAMDSATCEAHKLQRTYRQLAVINRVLSRMDGLLQRRIVDEVKASGGHASVLEVGCGGGDVLARLARMGRRAKVHLQLKGIDADPRAIAYARERFGDDPMLQFNVAGLDDVGGTFDYVFCNHVLHHVPPGGLASFVRRLSQLKRRRLIINDLERSAAAYASFTLLAALVFHRSFVFADGRLSIRKGFRATELARACEEAGLDDSVRVERLFPWRVVLSTERRPQH